jgi:hypothetical protein
MKFKDTYGATVTGDPATGWERGGVSIGPCSQEQANSILSGMAPDGWVPPEPPVVIPQTVTLFQLRSAMLATPEIYSVFNASTMLPTVAQAWQFAGDVSRTGTLATAIADTCNLSPSAMDDLFLAASQITA